MKKTAIVTVCILLIFTLFGCGQSNNVAEATNSSESVKKEVVNTPEKIRDDFFDSLYEATSGGKNEATIHSNIQAYESDEIIKNDENENEYVFKIDSGFSTPSESVVGLWTDNTGEVYGLATASFGNEGRNLLYAGIRTMAPDTNMDTISDDIFDFIYTDEENSEIEYSGLTVTKMFNNGQNIATTGPLISFYSVFKNDASDEFKEFFEERVHVVQDIVFSE